MPHGEGSGMRPNDELSSGSAQGTVRASSQATSDGAHGEREAGPKEEFLHRKCD